MLRFTPALLATTVFATTLASCSFGDPREAWKEVHDDYAGRIGALRKLLSLGRDRVAVSSAAVDPAIVANRKLVEDAMTGLQAQLGRFEAAFAAANAAVDQAIASGDDAKIRAAVGSATTTLGSAYEPITAALEAGAPVLQAAAKLPPPP